MKNITSALLLTCLSLAVSAQTKVDDGRLLDYYQTQRFAEASAYLKSVYTEPVTDKKALSQLAYTSNMAGNLPDAERYYQRIYDADSSNTGVLLSLAGINLRRGNNTKAENYYLQLIKRDSSNFLVYKQLARIKQEKGDIAGNIGYLQKANKLNPTEPDVASDLAEMYINLKMTPAAEKVLNVATAADPENIVLLESLMKLTYAQKKWQETVDACLKLIKAGSESSMIKTKLAVSYYNLKNYTCGVETLAEIPGIGQNEFTYYYSAMCFKALKDNKQAIVFLNKAITDGISPSIASYYGEIADSNEKLIRYKKAIAAYQKALQFDENPMLYYSLANLYETYLKDKPSAVRYYKKYLATKPPLVQKDYIAYATSQVEKGK
ncbi:hypothetical protein DYU05_03555 [Mucilaginibacter terrenus]|uniref:Uncharacterized protein n=1 Tax=Mucilaginibacter terrenus TaxID=2482727 RepID=A0A3E2NUR2_9SPHI|nr:tetratricopeptide repeat protein [Mucilaginibacter terrenus]RFZ84697.1 hypothetical protein DYU05_03555 [Mucilaginibacter terrenus]